MGKVGNALLMSLKQPPSYDHMSPCQQCWAFHTTPMTMHDHQNPTTLTLNPKPEIRRDVLCSISWLLKVLQYSEQPGQPVTNHVTRPQGKDKKSFIERRMSSSDVANRAKHQLAAAGLSEKYTVHGSRRGSMQHAVHVLGQSAEQVGAAAQIRTPGIVQRYLDPFRHTR